MANLLFHILKNAAQGAGGSATLAQTAQDLLWASWRLHDNEQVRCCEPQSKRWYWGWGQRICLLSCCAMGSGWRSVDDVQEGFLVFRKYACSPCPGCWGAMAHRHSGVFGNDKVFQKSQGCTFRSRAQQYH